MKDNKMLRFCKDSRGFLPTKATSESVGWDLRTPEDFKIEPNETKQIRLLLYSDLGVGIAAIIKERSGLALKGIHVHGGVIDSDYRGCWGIILHNSSEESILFNRGDRIAQFIVIKNHACTVKEVVTLQELEDRPSDRTGGFGSTGV